MIKILSETSIPYLIRHASFILSAGIHLYRRVQTSNIVGRKIVVHGGLELATVRLQV